MLPYRFSKGMCHVAALAFLSENPHLKLLAHVGMMQDEDGEDYIADWDHVVAFDPHSGRAYDAFGAHANATKAATLTDPEMVEDGELWMDLTTVSINDIREAVKKGILKRFTRRDFEQATAFARRVLSNETMKKPVGKPPGAVPTEMRRTTPRRRRDF